MHVSQQHAHSQHTCCIALQLHLALAAVSEVRLVDNRNSHAEGMSISDILGSMLAVIT